jgi:hypothetical protein
MSVTKVPYGQPVKLLVDYQGYPDGRLVQFEIWRKKGGEEKEVSNVYGVTKGGKGIGWWIPLVDRKGVLPLEETISYQGEEEKFYFVGKIDDQEVKSRDLVFVYPLEIYLEDEEELPIDDAECTVTFSDGSKKTGRLKEGRVKFEDAPVGKFLIEAKGYEFVFKSPGKIIKARWEMARARCGEEVKLIVDVEHFDDDTPVKFTVWEEDATGKNDQIEQIDGTVQGERAEAIWIYSTEEVEEDLKEDLEEEEEGGPEYFFTVDIDGEKARSGILTLTYTLEVYLEDTNGKPLDGLGYVITLSDGTRRKGELKDGCAKIEDAPYGKFTIEVEGFNFKTK